MQWLQKGHVGVNARLTQFDPAWYWFQITWMTPTVLLLKPDEMMRCPMRSPSQRARLSTFLMSKFFSLLNLKYFLINRSPHCVQKGIACLSDSRSILEEYGRQLKMHWSALIVSQKDSRQTNRIAGAGGSDVSPYLFFANLFPLGIKPARQKLFPLPDNFER